MSAPENPNAFKHAIDRAAVKRIATSIAAVEPEFTRARFVRRANAGLEALELKARVKHIIAALKDSLPQDPKLAVAAIVRAGEAWREPPSSEKYEFAAWPLVDFVGAHGLEDFEGSMQALRRLTPLFSAEFAIRPFILEDPGRALSIMAAWRSDDSEHVRRLVSEGSRPRLPWGQRLTPFVKDPRPVLELLEGLRDDPAEYVRRSVANNLNDVTKDHPELALEVCARWAEGASAERRWIVKHATRGLVKAGHPGALALLGYDPKAKVEVRGLAVGPDRARVGDVVRISFELVSKSARAQPLVVDYAVHHVKKDGRRTPKVFKLQTLELAPKARQRIEKQHSFRPVTTRVYYPGTHAIEILINGRSRGVVELELAP